MKISILNTGGTFSKVYNPLNGSLDIDTSNKKLKKILNIFSNVEFELVNIISKDSLYMTDDDRTLLADKIKNTKNENIIIIHGTDTMDKTAEFLEKHIQDKKILLVGAMVPLSIKTKEALANLSQAVGFLNADIKNGIYISMHGAVVLHSFIKKDKKIGKFIKKI